MNRQDPPQPTPCQKWINEHQEEYSAHEGENVAIHPEVGIVGSGTLRQAMEKAHKSGVDMSQVVYSFVSGARV